MPQEDIKKNLKINTNNLDNIHQDDLLERLKIAQHCYFKDINTIKLIQKEINYRKKNNIWL